MVDQAENTLDILDCNITELQTSLRAGATSRGARNLHSPPSATQQPPPHGKQQLSLRTPLYMFAFLLEDEYDEYGVIILGDDSLGSLHPIWVVSQVYIRWRQLARSSPTLWAAVSVHAGDHQDGQSVVFLDFDKCLRRIGAQWALAKTRPLSVQVVECIPPNEPPHHLGSLLQLLSLSRARLSRLSIAMRPHISLAHCFESLPSPSPDEPLFPMLEFLDYRAIPSQSAVPLAHATSTLEFPSSHRGAVNRHHIQWRRMAPRAMAP